MKWIKQIIVVIVIIILIVGGMLIWLRMSNNPEQTNTVTTQEIKVYRVTNRNLFYSVTNAISNYLDYIVEKDTKALYVLLDPQYIQEKNVTQQNVLRYVDTVNKKQVVDIQEMYQQEIDEDNSNFYAGGTIQDEERTEDKKEISIVVKVNFREETYTIVPFEKISENRISGGN